MAKVEIYTWQGCPYCIKAKGLLDGQGVDYIEHKIDGDDDARKAMSDRIDPSGGPTSVPQIFVDDVYIGDCSGIHDLDAAGELDKLLKLQIGNGGHDPKSCMYPA